MKRSDFFTMENGILHITSNAHMYPLSTLIRTELLLRPLSHNNLNTILNGTLFSGNGYEPLNIYLRLQFQDGTNEDMLLTPKPVIRHNLDYYEIVRRGRKLQEILASGDRSHRKTCGTAALGFLIPEYNRLYKQIVKERMPAGIRFLPYTPSCSQRADSTS